jgi:hypothetical protein
MYYMRIMAGVLAILRSHKRVMHCDPKALELEAAKEILAEVFRVNIPDVDEMIQNRFDQPHSQDDGNEEDGLWPREFWLDAH